MCTLSVYRLSLASQQRVQTSKKVCADKTGAPQSATSTDVLADTAASLSKALFSLSLSPSSLDSICCCSFQSVKLPDQHYHLCLPTVFKVLSPLVLTTLTPLQPMTFCDHHYHHHHWRLCSVKPAVVITKKQHELRTSAGQLLDGESRLRYCVTILTLTQMTQCYCCNVPSTSLTHFHLSQLLFWATF